jgi:PKD repeat protein
MALPASIASPGSRVAVATVSPLESTSAYARAPALTSPTHPAASMPTWINVTRNATRNGTPVAPPGGYAESVASDPLDGVTVLFGGCLASQCPSDQTWVFANGSWTNVTPRSGSPPARDYASMDYDANMGGDLLFGGVNAAGAYLNDTWLYAGGIWTNVTFVGGGPAPRFGASMAFDPDPEENGSVLYGGCVAVSLVDSCFNDTWVWEGWSGWVKLSPSLNGPGVGFAAMAFDPFGDLLVLFGGCSGTLCLSVSNQTWELYGGQWWLDHPAVSPSARTDVAMAYDPAGHGLLLFGGLDASLSYDADTWSFAAGVWTLLSPSAAPSARSDFGLALDGSGTTLLLVGGEGNGPAENDTWAFEVPVSVTLAPSTSTAETSQPVTFTATLAGGTGPFFVVAAFGDGTSGYSVGPGPAITTVRDYLDAGTYSASVRVADSLGATATSTSSSVTVGTGPAVTPTASPPVGEVGIPVAFGTNVTSGGASPLTYAWAFGDNTTGTGATPTHAYAAVGVYTVYLNVTDSLGGTSDSSLMVTIDAAPHVVISYLPSQPNASSLVMFSASITGGVGPFHYAWTLGNGNASAEPSPVVRYGHAGSFTISLFANDSLGGSSHATVSVSVTGTPGPSTSGSGVAGAPLWFWGGLGAVVVVGALGSVLLLRRRR